MYHVRPSQRNMKSSLSSLSKYVRGNSRDGKGGATPRGQRTEQGCPSGAELTPMRTTDLKTAKRQPSESMESHLLPRRTGPPPDDAHVPLAHCMSFLACRAETMLVL
ncbi:unnamed protein product [Pleuronectes platessa]|uniref:Uncharacterized protein n=1 Tax=Pleuronectes platessa TaxID=8262 RepID=A0A9N7Y7D4_PLEPL|nr:unnamed protein product [Pleuronectes platessa]